MYGDCQITRQNWVDGVEYNWIVPDTVHFQNTDEWQHFSASLNAFPVNINRVGLNLFTVLPEDPQGLVSCWSDNIVLTPIPEPSAAALLGAGAALMLRRRKRRA